MNMKLLPENKEYRLTGILIHVIGWGIVFGFPFFLNSRTGNTMDLRDYFRHIGVPLSFFIVFYVNYFYLIPRHLFKGQQLRYLLLCVLTIVVMGVLLHLWQSMNMPPHPKAPHRPGPPPWVFLTRDIISMVFVASLSVAIRMSLRWRKTESARKEAEKSRSEAELKNLKNQLNPHFLLNTLNNIYALIAFDTDKAQDAVQELSKLLRYVLYDNQADLVLLSKEADFIRNYIELMKIRLAGNVYLETHIDIRSDSTTLIAPLLFISLIENAFKHGVSPVQQSFIRINLSEDSEGHVCCEIKNSNFPKTDNDKSGSGIGLTHVKKRLELIYPDAYRWTKGITEDDYTYKSMLVISTNKPKSHDS